MSGMTLRRRIMILLAVAAVLPSLQAGAAMPPLRLGDGDRLLILAPHPTDGILAAGGLIQEALALDLPVHVCFFTMGDNHEIHSLFTRQHPNPLPGTARSMAPRRQIEAITAAGQLGLSSDQLIFLGYPDGGTLNIWQRHWRSIPPFHSALTGGHAVPYERALTPGSAYAGEDILDDIMEVLRDIQPTLLLVPHPADHNADHRALYLFARAALGQMTSEEPAPRVLTCPVHFTQWPEPRRFQPLRHAAPPYFLHEGTTWLEFGLAPFQVTNKLAAIRRHHSQFRAFPAYLESFVRKTELFGSIPDLAFPGGIGTAEITDDDVSRFRPDDTLQEELARLSEPWSALAGQQAAETQAVAGHDNHFVMQTLSGDGQYLTLGFKWASPLSAASTVTIHLFGQRADTPFGDMPKITMMTALHQRMAVHDLDTPLPSHIVDRLPGGDNELILRVPYARLGTPDRLFIGAQLSKGRLPVDWLPWRVLDLSGTSVETPPHPDSTAPLAAHPPVLPPPHPPAPAASTPPPAA
ncbi:MAG: PIG-L family deacetylase, partial [Kiritimatiellia bacterium]|nr:PIG-L family deacetylase [Kiritimatiellia bacterium]